MTQRINWTDYFLQIADAVAARADCTRRKVGAVVVDAQTKHLISTGYNGAAPGEPGCLSDGACPRGRHYKIMNTEFYKSGHGEICATCKLPWPCAMSVAPGSSYDTGAGACTSLHAELNACIRAGDRAQGALLFCTDEPCDGCIKVMKSAGIAQAVWYEGTWYQGGEPKKTWLKRLLHK